MGRSELKFGEEGKGLLVVDIEKRLEHFLLDIEFTLEKGIMVLVGPSGSGKTTILNCIAGIVEPDAGLIRFQDKVFFSKNQSLPIQARRIGYVFQEYALFPHMTVWKNIQYGMKDEDLARQLMEEFQIDHLKNKFPQDISGGEKQRVAVVRALATKPRLLLLDEPFSALDDETRELGHLQLLKLHEQWNIPMILVTHSKSEAEKLGDVQYVVKRGRIVEYKEL